MKSYRRKYKRTVVIMFLLCQIGTAQTWEEIGINLPDGDTASYNTKITFANKDTGWLYTEFYKEETNYKKLYRTTDGGKSWETVINKNDIGSYNTVLFSMEPDFFYMINSVSKALFTTDGGNTWDSTVVGYSDVGYSTLYFFNEKRGITFYDHSFITTDGGKNWERKGEISFPLDIYFYNDTLGWAVGWSLFATDNNYIAKTTDGGKTWEYLDYLIPAFFIAENGIEFIDSLNGFIIGEALIKTTDGGKNWNRDYNVLGYDIGFLDNKYGWISSAGNIFHTTDGGETWGTQLDTVKNFSFKKIIILKKDKVAYTLGLSLLNNNATILRADLSYLTDVVDNKQAIPEKYNLAQNYPNPFNPTTSIEYQVSRLEMVTLKIYDILGNDIATLVNETKLPGTYKVNFDGNQLASGVYIARLTTGRFNKSIKLILLK